MELSSSGIPIINLYHASGEYSKNTLSQQFTEACENAGCFYIKNHGIDSVLIDSLFTDFRSFFNEQLEYKMKFKLNYFLDRGYFPYETQNVNAFMGRLNLPNDPVEKLAFGPIGLVPENIWPDRPPTLKSNVENYYENMRHLAGKLAGIFAVALDVPDENYFYQTCYDAPHVMKANWYPGVNGPKINQSTRFAAHTDRTAFTILTSDTCQGSLQILNGNGHWVNADPVPGALFVNLGDVLQHWTNDKWKSTMHKVVWPENGNIPDRLSVVYFVSIKQDTLIQCIPSCCPKGQRPKYEPITYSDFLAGPMKNLSNVY